MAGEKQWIGKISNNDEMVCIKLDAKYSEGLKGLSEYSHVQVLWWADGCDNESDRSILIEDKDSLLMSMSSIDFSLHMVSL